MSTPRPKAKPMMANFKSEITPEQAERISAYFGKNKKIKKGEQVLEWVLAAIDAEEKAEAMKREEAKAS